MNASDLYKEEPCRRCGQNVLKTASFCPYCGHVKSKSWVERLGEMFGGGEEKPAGRSGSSGLSVPTLLGLAFAGYMVYTAIDKGSVQSIIMAVLVLFAVLQSWYAQKRKAEQAEKGETPAGSGSSEPSSIPEDKFFCENCGAEVPADASRCPKCGHEFG